MAKTPAPFKGGIYLNETTFFFRGYLSLHPDEGMKLTVNEPRSTVGGSRIMALDVAVPKSVFAIPSMKASIRVDDKGMPEFSVDAVAVSDALKAVVGADVSVTIHRTEEPQED